MTYKRMLNLEASITFSLSAVVIGLLLFMGIRIIQLKQLQLQAAHMERSLIDLNYHTRSILLETGYSLQDLSDRLDKDINTFDSSLAELKYKYNRIFHMQDIPNSLRLAEKLWRSTEPDYHHIGSLLNSLIESGFSKRFVGTTGLLRHNVHIPQSELHLNLDHSYLLKLENAIETQIASGSAYEQLMNNLADTVNQKVRIYTMAAVLIASTLILIVIIMIILYILFYSRQRLIREIDRLFLQGIEKEKAIRMAQIKALRYQINPHFLYNTLTSISFVADEEESPRTLALLHSLSGFFQKTLYHTSRTISLTEEIQIDRHYLDMLQLRYNNAIHVVWNILDNPDDYFLLPTLVQPLIENAVMHGLSSLINRKEDAELIISAYLERHYFVLSVADNGPGFQFNPLQTEVREGCEDRNHIGLRNVMDRIQSHYGSHFYLKPEFHGSGAEVKLYLPVQKERAPL